MSKSICIVSPSVNMGGIERALVVLANYFVSEGHKVSFISCLARHHFYVLDTKIYLIEPDFKHSGRFLTKIIYYLRVSFFIRRTIRKIQPDVVLSFGDWFNPLVLMSLLGLEYPAFISDRTSPDFKFKFPIKPFKRWLYPKSAGFIAQTRRAADYNHEKFGKIKHSCHSECIKGGKIISRDLKGKDHSLCRTVFMGKRSGKVD